MTKETKMRLHRIFNIILAVSIVLTGLCFIAGCLRIYYNVSFADTKILGIELPFPEFTPGQPYSGEIVAETFGMIAVPVYITVALCIVGFVYEFISPINIKRKKVNKDNENLAKRLCEKKNIANADVDREILGKIKREQTARAVRKAVCLGLTVIGAVVFLSYAASPDNYTEDINGSVINAFLVFLSCIAIPFAYTVYSAYAKGKSLEKEIELLKKLPDAKESDVKRKEEKSTVLFVTVARVVIILVAVAVLAVGIFGGGFEDVLTKAVNICTECIGLG